MKRIALFALITLAGCSSTAIPMTNAAGESVDCGSRSELWLWDVTANPPRERSCVADFQAQGFKRVAK